MVHSLNSMMRVMMVMILRKMVPMMIETQTEALNRKEGVKRPKFMKVVTERHSECNK